MQRQLAVKIMIIFVIGMLVLIPTSMVKYKIYERHSYLEQAKATVTESWTGKQLIVTPVLVVPYRELVPIKSGFQTSETLANNSAKTVKKLSVLVPDQFNQRVSVENSRVYKGIYEVPVYSSLINLTGVFSQKKIKEHLDYLQNQAGFEAIEQPYLVVHIADMRGVDRQPALSINGAELELVPGSRMSGGLESGLHANLRKSSLEDSDIDFSLDLSLRGMGSFSFVPLADNAEVTMQSAWPHPEFIGASLPKSRDISSAGFSASWTATRYSSQGVGLVNRCVVGGDCNGLVASASGVSFIEPVDIYLQSERTVKYAILFIGLSFITFFIFEHVTSLRIHPIQYTFIGLAIAVFYLLLISMAEHIPFYWAYTLGVVCCSSLILFYVRYMLRSLTSALWFSAMIIGLYGLLYIIVQAEDFALLMGAILVFLVLAVLMYTTRHIDWYSVSSPGRD